MKQKNTKRKAKEQKRKAITSDPREARVISNIEYYCKINGVTKDDLYKMMGVSEDTLYRRYKKVGDLKLSEIFRISDGMNIIPRQLLEGTDSPSSKRLRVSQKRYINEV